LTIYAGWKKRHTVTLHNVSDAPQPLYVCDGDSLTLAMPQKPDVSFVDWYADSAFTVKFGGVTKASCDTTLYARWINALRVEVSEGDGYSCNGLRNPFTFFAAYEDEPGTYSNTIKPINPNIAVGDYWEENGDYYTIKGSNYSGGAADATCRSKGEGWYLPSKCEFSRMMRNNTQPFQPFPDGVTYWTSSAVGDYAVSYEKCKDESCWTIGQKRNTDRHKVRCVWRPQ
jgi:hypothetical protein